MVVFHSRMDLSGEPNFDEYLSFYKSSACFLCPLM